MKLAPQAVDPRSVQIELEKCRALLRDLEWSYPPVDAFAGMGGSWTRSARCPACFQEWNPAGKHASNCNLAARVDQPGGFSLALPDRPNWWRRTMYRLLLGWTVTRGHEFGITDIDAVRRRDQPARTLQVTDRTTNGRGN